MHAGGYSMGSAKLDFRPKFEQSGRIVTLLKHSRDLALAGKRNLYGPDISDLETLVFGNNGTKCENPVGEPMVYGDHACWIDIGPFPFLNDMPSRVYGYEATGKSWGQDYAFLLDHTPAAIHEGERIVGEIYWEMHMVRQYAWPEHVLDIGMKARKMGAGGISSQHTCPDLAIGLTQGWGGILQRIQASRQKYQELDELEKVNYLTGLQLICESVIRFIQRYSVLAAEMALTEKDPDRRDELLRISACCSNIATEPPKNYYEGVQWIHFAVILDRVVGHGNGYGRLDQYLISLYRKSLAENQLSRVEAREYLSEMFLKLRGHFFSLGGRTKDLGDATNEMSFIVLEAYDLIGDYNNLAVMWHPDINKDFYDYACDVLARHGEAIPILVNHDVMISAELRSGVPEKDAWNVSLSGCQWFSIPGKEYCDQDVNTIVAISPFKRCMDRAIENNVDHFEDLYSIYTDEFKKTAYAFREFKNSQCELIGNLWPEMFTSMNSHGPIERGLDMVASRGVDYQFTSCNILGIPNVVDSLFALKKLVFEQKRYTLREVKEATDANWQGREAMRRQFLSQDKFGNDIDDVDALAVRLSESIASIMGSMVSLRGAQPFRASLFHFQGHAAPELIGATPDGRFAEEYLAHGINPAPGRNEKGLLAMANSINKFDQRKFQGGTLQVELQPKFFDGKDDIGSYIRRFSEVFFQKGGVQINLDIMDLQKLREAIDHPENPEYQNIIIRVTGYATRFVMLSKIFQIEFVERSNFKEI
jgi:pyruvate-formate lyase